MVNPKLIQRINGEYFGPQLTSSHLTGEADTSHSLKKKTDHNGLFDEERPAIG
jgi:hypothetical protein